MDTRQLIEASATVVTITSFKPGDVYKRTESDYQGNASLRYGVVTDVMHNGTDAALVALEYRPEYSSVVVEEKVWDGSKPTALFPATPVEVRHHLSRLEDSAEVKLKAARRELESAETMRGIVAELVATAAESGLSAPETVIGELVQGDVAPPEPI